MDLSSVPGISVLFRFANGNCRNDSFMILNEKLTHMMKLSDIAAIEVRRLERST